LFPKCIKCNHKVSASWLVIGFINTKYRCVKCSALYEFSTFRRRLSVLTAPIIMFYFIYSKNLSYISEFKLLFPLVLLSILFSVLPNQFVLSKDETGEVET